MEEKIRLAVFGQKRLSREGGIEIVVKELCTRMAQNGCDVTCYNRAGHHVSGAEYDKTIEYDGIRQKVVPTIEKKGLAAVSSSFFAALYSAFGRYDVVHTGSYTANYEDFSDTEYLFGGTSIKREAGKDLSIDCALEVTDGTAKVFWISGADEEVTLLETTGTYSDTITLPEGGNYIGIECENFTGSIELNME